MNKNYSYILTITFIVILILPQASKMSNIFQVSSTDENRNLAKIPKADIEHLDVFPKQFDDYYNDNFGLRSIGLKLYNNFNYFLLKKIPSSSKSDIRKRWLAVSRSRYRFYTKE